MLQASSYLKTVPVMLYASLVASCSNFGAITPDSDAVTRIQIISEPPGAEIYLMGTKAGVTPAEIRERDIYPVSYEPEMEKYYGHVVLRKEGCKVFSKRLTRKDVYRGLDVKLDCGTRTTEIPAPEPSPVTAPPVTAPAPAPVPEPKPQVRVIAPTPTPAPTLPEQQIEQLRVLQKLQEEGVLSAEEEKKLRKRILDSH